MRRELRGAYRYLGDAGPFLSYTVEDFPVRLIGLDTVIPGEGGGEICAEREAWFADRLAEGDGRPTLVFMHHPPFATGVHGMDEIMCRVSASFGALVRSHPEIERILCGHYHRPIVRRWNGTVGYVVPGVAHQVALDLRPGEPNRLILEPAAFALHSWAPETGMVSHTVPLGHFGKSAEFSLDPSYPGAGGRQ
jgi:3',5'-cyclic AMP phosphodiesterase CpdA